MYPASEEEEEAEERQALKLKFRKSRNSEIRKSK